MTFSDDAGVHIDPLGGLTLRQTRWLVAEAHKVLTRLRVDARLVTGDAFELTTGQTIGLVNLARTIHGLPRKTWPRAVREHLTTMVGTDMTRSPAPDQLRPKLQNADMLPTGPMAYEPLEPLPGVLAVLSAQWDGATAVYGTLDQIGMPRDEAYDIALSNLAGLPLPRWTRRRADKRVAGSWVEFLDSPDPCGAARVLLLPEMFRRVLKQPFPASGVLVAVPTKHELWIHVPTDPDTTIATALRLVVLAMETFCSDPHPVSPDIFLVSPDMQARTLITADPEGVDLHPDVMTDLLMALDPGHEQAG